MRVEGVAKSRDRRMWGFNLSETVVRAREGRVPANRAGREDLHGSLASGTRLRETFCKDTNVGAWGTG